MQTILIPSDFSLASFKCISALCDEFKGKQLNLVFTHLFKLSDSITDLLMLSRRNREYELVPESFYTECRRIKAQNQEIASVKIEFFYGSTVAAFREFLNAQGITGIVNPADCSFKKLSNLSIHPASLIEKTASADLKIISGQIRSAARPKNQPAQQIMLEEV